MPTEVEEGAGDFTGRANGSRVNYSPFQNMPTYPAPVIDNDTCAGTFVDSRNSVTMRSETDITSQEQYVKARVVEMAASNSSPGMVVFARHDGAGTTPVTQPDGYCFTVTPTGYGLYKWGVDDSFIEFTNDQIVVTPPFDMAIRAESTGTEGECKLTGYIDDVEVATYTDTTSILVGNDAGWLIRSDQSPYGKFDTVSWGRLEDSGSVVINNVNGDDIVKSKGEFVINGANLGTVTAVEISDAGARPHSLTFNLGSETDIGIQNFDIMDTPHIYGAVRLTLTHPGGTVDHTITLAVEDGWQAVVMSGINDQLMAKDIVGVADGWTLEIPTVVAGSAVTLDAASDTRYSPAVPHLTTHERRAFDPVNFIWDSGQVTVNQTLVDGNPPVWIGAPNPPPAKAGEAYSYNIGQFLQGDRPMTLTDAGTPLPTGLTYNAAASPETIEGTIPVGTETQTLAGIVVRAENSV